MPSQLVLNEHRRPNRFPVATFSMSCWFDQLVHQRRDGLCGHSRCFSFVPPFSCAFESHADKITRPASLTYRTGCCYAYHGKTLDNSRAIYARSWRIIYRSVACSTGYPEALEKHRDVQMSSDLDEFKKPIEEWAQAVVDGKPMENLLILYKLLYALGCRIDGIDFEIDRLCVAAIKKAKALS
jgi:hypothetical protein